MATASATIRIKITGRSGTEKLIKRLENNAAELAKETAKVIHETAVFEAPVLTGRLKQSITTSKRKATNGYQVKVGARYGVYVNYGTRHHAPQPFFTAAVAAGRVYFAANATRIFR